jgi:hypothetical protein
VVAASDDNRDVLFISQSNRLVENDTNAHGTGGVFDLFYRNNLTDETTKLASNIDVVSTVVGTVPKNFKVTPNFQYVLFSANDDTLATGDTNAISDLYLRNRDTEITKRVNINSSGEEAYKWRYYRFYEVSPTIHEVDMSDD